MLVKNQGNLVALPVTQWVAMSNLLTSLTEPLNRRKRLAAPSIAATWLLGFIMLLLRVELADTFGIGYFHFLFLALVLILFGSGFALFAYLRGDFSTAPVRSSVWEPSVSRSENEVRELHHQISFVRNSIEQLRDDLYRLSRDLSERSAARIEPPEPAYAVLPAEQRGSIEDVTANAESIGSGMIKQIQEIRQLLEVNHGAIERLRMELEAGREASLRENRVETIKQLNEHLQAVLPQDLLSLFESKYGTAIRNSEYLRELRNQFALAKSRLAIEISALSRRGNVNLLIGSLTTVAAVSLLGYIVLHTEIVVSDWKSVLPGIVLRLSIVVFIEIFSYFFLRLYRSGLHEIKYFQNELTNLDAKSIALESALVGADPEAAKAIVQELAKTDRNFVLHPGESTVDLERLRFENQTVKDALQSISTALSKVSRG